MDYSKCYECGEPVTNYEPQMCCSGYMCGCLGRPTNPPYCEACKQVTDDEPEQEKD